MNTRFRARVQFREEHPANQARSNDVEVVEPDGLREVVLERLRRAVSAYERKGT